MSRPVSTYFTNLGAAGTVGAALEVDRAESIGGAGVRVPGDVPNLLISRRRRPSDGVEVEVLADQPPTAAPAPGEPGEIQTVSKSTRDSNFFLFIIHEDTSYLTRFWQTRQTGEHLPKIKTKKSSCKRTKATEHVLSW